MPLLYSAPGPAALRATFPRTYREFFEANDLVVSVAFSFPWGSNGPTHYSRYLRAKSKVGLRCFVGFRRAGTSGAAIRDITSYDAGLGEFVSGDRLHHEEGLVEDAAVRLLDAASFGSGVEIGVLAETARGHSFGLSGTSCAGIAAGLHLLSGKFSPDDLRDPVAFSRSPRFDALFRLAWEFDFHFRHGNSTGHTAYAALSPWAGPEILVTEAYDANLPPQRLPKIRYSPLSLQQKAGVGAGYAGAPVDYCMVYSGQPAVPVSKNEEHRMEDFVGIDRRRLVLGKDVLGASGADFDTYASRLLYGGAAVSAVDDVTLLLNAHTVELFRRFYREGASAPLTEAFLRHVDAYRHVTSIFRTFPDFAEEFRYAFRSLSGPSGQVAIMPSYLDREGGGYVVTVPAGQGRQAVAGAVERLRAAYPDATVEYASWEDGQPHEGLRVEQWKSQGIVPPAWLG